MQKQNKRNIKFALILKNGEEARTMRELKENFDIYEILESFVNDKLGEWLEDRYYEDKAKEMNELYKSYKNNEITDIFLIVEKICKILGIQYTDETEKAINNEIQKLKEDCPDIACEADVKSVAMDIVEELEKKAEEINGMTDDMEARKNFREVARNQEELDKLLKTKDEIYLLPLENEEKYKIPASKDKTCYIGVEDTKDNLPRAIIVSDDKDFLTEEEVKNLEDIHFSNLFLYFKNDANLSENDNQEKILFDYEGKQIYENKINKKNAKELGKKVTKVVSKDNSLKSVQKRIIRCMDANFPLIYLKTFEEGKADEIICSVLEGRKFYEWNAEGFFEKDEEGKRTGHWARGWSLRDTLSRFIGSDLFQVHDAPDLERSVLVLKDAHKYLEDNEIIAKLKYLCQIIYRGDLRDCNIVIVSPILVMPKEIENYITVVTLDYLREDEIRELIKKICTENGVDTDKLSNEFKKQLVEALKGLSRFDIQNIISLAISSDKELNAADWERIIEHKKQMVEKTNILEMIDVEIDKDAIGGLENLKNWLEVKSQIYKNWEAAKSYNVDIPKGVMIAGMPGCGKSITAKVTADMFDIPLLRMDIGKIMGKYVGESEQRMRQALRLSESVAPCVLWIDEIEKAFSGINGEGGGAEVTTRLFGTFLTWMQEKKERVFVVATANDATKLPPELLRKGRFDEIFYVDFPLPNERRQIFKIHFEKRHKKDSWDYIEKHKDKLKELIRRTRGYSGADIEGLIKETIERDFVENKLNKLNKKISDSNISVENQNYNGEDKSPQEDVEKEKFFKILMEVRKNITPLKDSMGGALNGLIQTYKKGRFRSATKKNNEDKDEDGIKDKMDDKLEILKEKVDNLSTKIRKRISSKGARNDQTKPKNG